MLHTFKSRKIKQGFTKKFLWTLLLFPLIAFTLHKEYYSLTKIDYNQKEKAVQITMRLFTDDLELALNKQYNKTVELGTSIEINDADALIKSYLNQTFRLTINNKTANYQLLGKEFEKNAVYIYLEIPNVNNITEISVYATMLVDTFFEQENIIKLNINNQNKSLILTINNNKGLLKF